MKTNKPTFLGDFIKLLFSSRRFFEQRFMHVSANRIFLMSFVGVFVGLLCGSLLTVGFSHYVAREFMMDQTPYLAAIEGLQLTPDTFLEMLKTQQAYSLMLALLSPIIAYIAPHLFGGALFAFLWLLYRPNHPAGFHRVMECAAAALPSMVFYIFPGVGPLIALVLVSINTSRALAIQYNLFGFLKIMSIVSAMYLCFFLTSATFQLLAIPMTNMIKF